ncbi:large subunit ribosomal protein L6 [Halohasta litchfieldiae]|jgi:large subunit ribosomal protein L6|uniref:Large ribosomal subunit protein uL6 n=1 Tax=Halohasta litchfieldiae TaxID=1073996 RepID=A0A1H6X9M8_9EURY|nr:50S ribosomal protein L6 [Halohasta litchfieldiae]ATW90073.1 large subunit ribosomal protein L6 [Halohasta litchfieldiae]SEJ21285.1 LSU ribosomal protein L6P [Halohasta litchfieldiae]
MTRTEISLPEDVSATVDHLELTVEGPDGSVTRRLWFPDVTVSVEDDAVVIATDVEDAKTTATVGTFESHVRNMIHGVSEGWEYKMEIHYAHFPMQVTVEGDDVVIENFLGEKADRRTPIRGDTDVQVDGEEVTLSGSDKEAVGQTAADIEQLTRVNDKDTRVFQDGVYIVEKPTAGGA